MFERSYVRPMTTLPTTEARDALAHAVVTDGLDPHREELAALVRAARRLGIRPVLTGVLADAGAPRPVRERALGLLLVALDIHDGVPALVATGAVSAA